MALGEARCLEAALATYQTISSHMVHVTFFPNNVVNNMFLFQGSSGPLSPSEFDLDNTKGHSMYTFLLYLIKYVAF